MQTRFQTQLSMQSSHRSGAITRSLSKTITTSTPSSPVTRSQVQSGVFHFDDSSIEWFRNKPKMKNVSYNYTNSIGMTTRSGMVLCS